MLTSKAASRHPRLCMPGPFAAAGDRNNRIPGRWLARRVRSMAITTTAVSSRSGYRHCCTERPNRRATPPLTAQSPLDIQHLFGSEPVQALLGGGSRLATCLDQAMASRVVSHTGDTQGWHSFVLADHRRLSRPLRVTARGG